MELDICKHTHVIFDIKITMCKHDMQLKLFQFIIPLTSPDTTPVNLSSGNNTPEWISPNRSIDPNPIIKIHTTDNTTIQQTCVNLDTQGPHKDSPISHCHILFP